MMSVLRYAVWVLLAISAGVGHPAEGGRHIVYINHNNYPSLLYINAANGGRTAMDTRADTSDIINLILYPADQDAKKFQKATVVLSGGVEGTLTFTQDDLPIGQTRIEGVINKLTPGPHGFHIHMLGDLSGGCVTAAGHYNPYMKNHGAPEHRERHVGDLGNIFADNTGQAVVNITDPLLSLVGPRSVVGRAVVVHAGEDDLGSGGNEDSLKTGNAGGRVGCGVIGYA
uniref:Superoxide dismutase [Cu-Zn] n=1 Tax=Neocaridina denticulata sinensis TaxID=274643 RepID=A0A976X680_NEODE|nr:Cu/Zn superoxide dismutase [Neocaridina denticulata sinensis]